MSEPVLIGDAQLFLGDCIDVMRSLPNNSIDSLVTDPPYGIRFMGKAWDGEDIERRANQRRSHESHDPHAGPNGGHKSAAAEAGKYDLTPNAMRAFQSFSQEWATEAFRILKPGAHLLSFAAARTYHRMASGIEDAGFEIRDQLMWIYGSGFPKSHNGDWGGTALKPAHEPIVMARKPLDGTVASNVQNHGTGALNIDGCRIAHDESLRVGAGTTWHVIHAHEGRAGEATASKRYTDEGGTNFAMLPGVGGGDAAGRWPANVIHDGSDEVVKHFPDDAGGGTPSLGKSDSTLHAFGKYANRSLIGHIDFGSAARFFYCAKTSKADRNEGLELFEKRAFGMSNAAAAAEKGEHYDNGDGGVNRVTFRQNHHPTVKPTELMRYLLRLVTPRGGGALDPFMGSGSTGKAALLEHFRFIGIEREPEYFEIAKARIEYIRANGVQVGLFGEAA
ncbi:MAG: DNA-methyltransferase [Casimicrobium sp.]